MRASQIADLVVGTGAVIAAGTVLVLSASLPTLAADPAGLALWPRALSIVILVAGLITLVGHAYRRPDQDLESGDVIPSNGGIATLPMGRVAVCAGLCIVYAFLVAAMGFSLPSFLFVATLMLFFGGRPVETLIYAAALTAGLYLFFFHVLGATPPSQDWLIAMLGGRL